MKVRTVALLVALSAVLFGCTVTSEDSTVADAMKSCRTIQDEAVRGQCIASVVQAFSQTQAKR